MMSAVGSSVLYAVEVALEIALTISVSVGAAAGMAVAASAPADAEAVADAAYGSVLVIKFWKPCCVSVTRLSNTVVGLTLGNNPNGVATFAGESAVTE